MKKQLFLILWVTVFFSITLFAQDNPGEEVVINAAKSVITTKFEQNELQDFVRYSEDPIIYVHGNFSGIQRKECIAICPMMRQTGTAGAYQKFVMLFYKSATGTWTKGNFAVLELEVDTTDLDHDQFPELICKNEWAWMGESHNKTTIYQLKGDAEKVIYSNVSEEYSMGLEAGSEASKIYEISFTDTNMDGIMEIEENLTTGIVERIDNDDAKLYYKKTKRTLYLKNGMYQ